MCMGKAGNSNFHAHCLHILVKVSADLELKMHTFLKIEFTQEVKRKMTFLNALIVIIYQAKILIYVHSIALHKGERLYVISVSILK